MTTIADIRRALGFSVGEMAEALGLSQNGNGEERVREYERGRDVVGPLRQLLDYVAQAVDVEECPVTTDMLLRLLPRFLDCTDLSGESEAEIIMHTRWPRFYGFVTDDLSHKTAAEAKERGMPVISLPAHIGLGYLVIVFIDPIVRDPTPVIDAAIRLKIEQAQDDLGF